MSVAVTLVGAVTGPEVTFVDRTTLLPIESVKTMQLLTLETSDVIAPTPWPANSPNISPGDYQIWGSCTTAGFMTSPS